MIYVQYIYKYLLLTYTVIFVERREIDLKEKLHTLQKAQSELELALQEQRKSNDDLKIELKDQDELIHSSIQFQKENQKLSSDVSRLRESESFLTGRVDELEQESSSLKTTLTSAGNIPTINTMFEFNIHQIITFFHNISNHYYIISTFIMQIEK